MHDVYTKMEEIHFSESVLKKMALDREYKSETDKINNEVNRSVSFGIRLRKKLAKARKSL